MTPLEFLLRLKKLSPDTPLAMAHLGAIFEMLSPVIIKEPSAIALDARLTNEEDLAKWLGQHEITVQQWRIQGSRPTQYRLSAVYDWIVAHIIPLFSSAASAENKPDMQLDDMAAAWKMHIPLMKVHDRLVGFFRSIVEEAEASEYRLANLPALSFHTGEMARERFTTINDSLIAHGEFSIAVADSVSTARSIYEKWKIQAIPEVRLQFFQSALIHNADLAEEIAAGLDAELIHKGFNMTLWLWQQFLENDFCSLTENALISALEISERHTADLNQLSHILDDRGQEIFHGSVSHLLADTRGDFFHLPSLDHCPGNYDRLLKCALDLGLDIEKQNNQGATATNMGAAVEEKYGGGRSLFNNFVRKYKLNLKLNANRASEPSRSRKPEF